MSAPEIKIESNELTIKQVFDAPIERLFACFTQPDLLIQWHAPSDTMTITAQVDLRPGGDYNITMTGSDGQSHVAFGQYQVVDEPNRLVYSWRWQGRDGPDTLVTVSFKAHGAQTEVELTHNGFVDQDTTEHHSEGWSGIFARLSIHLI